MVECAGLEIQCTFRRTVSSNLTLSAKQLMETRRAQGRLQVANGKFRFRLSVADLSQEECLRQATAAAGQVL